MQQSVDTAKGFWFALTGYLMWGIFPLYFFLVKDVPPMEVLVHRVLWSMLLLLLISFFLKTKQTWRDVFKSKQALLGSAICSLILCFNWLIYIWAVGNNMALEGSLGYFINPLVSVLLAVLFLGERLNKTQLLAIAFASVGVLYLVFKAGEVPIVALALAVSFALYGLLRKRFSIDAFAGLTVETMLIAPFAAAYMIYLATSGNARFLNVDWQTDSLLLSAGVITTVPLLFFLASLPLLRLSSVGLIQYIAPTLQFFMAVYILKESFNQDKLVAFVFIWCGLIVFTMDVVAQRRKLN